MAPRTRQTSNIIKEIPSSVISEVKPPVIRAPTPGQVPIPPVVRGISPPVVRVPNPTIEYPQFQAPRPVPTVPEESPETPRVPPTSPEESQDTPTNTRDLPNTLSTPQIPPTPQTPIINVGGLNIPLPEPAPLVAAGSLAVVTTVVTLGATIAVGQVKTALEPVLKKVLAGAGKKKKIKIKQVKPVLHFIPNEDGTTEIIQYSQKGMKVLEGGIEKLEQYLRDQVEIDALWEYDNKVIIDEELSKQLTKEGQKRFKKYFAAPKVIAKKLGAKFAF